MTRPAALLGRSRTLVASLIALVAALALAGLLTGSAGALKPSNRAVPAPPTNPTRADQIQNLDQVKTAIKAYYGDTLDGKTTPTGNPEHVPSPSGAYADEMATIETQASRFLDHYKSTHNGANAKNPAIVLDIDDTTLNTYNYEIDSNFVFNPTTNAQFVNGAAFPAVFGMPDLVNKAKAEGFTIFYLTGRPEAQRPGTLTNLTNAGYPVVSSQVYLSDQANEPWLSSCAPTCNRVQYKSLTRQHIESLGYTIAANMGDQYSDLLGGFSVKTFKLPNPMYYLP